MDSETAKPIKSHLRTKPRAAESKCQVNWKLSERETVVELPWAADCRPCVEKLRTVLPVTVGIRGWCGETHVEAELGRGGAEGREDEAARLLYTTHGPYA
jgi:hypothetical protein